MANNKRQKDQEMAQRLKAIGEERRSGQCCICHRVITLDRIVHHVTAGCSGPSKRSGSGGHSVFYNKVV